MDKYAQKLGEWEPEQRHSLNLKADSDPRETITFFIANELDYNTINIWRAVAAAPLESTHSHKPVSGVVIMPLTNGDIMTFLQRGVDQRQIIQATMDSFRKVIQITDSHWRQEITSRLLK